MTTRDPFESRIEGELDKHAHSIVVPDPHFGANAAPHGRRWREWGGTGVIVTFAAACAIVIALPLHGTPSTNSTGPHNAAVSSGPRLPGGVMIPATTPNVTVQHPTPQATSVPPVVSVPGATFAPTPLPCQSGTGVNVPATSTTTSQTASPSRSTVTPSPLTPSPSPSDHTSPQSLPSPTICA